MFLVFFRTLPTFERTVAHPRGSAVRSYSSFCRAVLITAFAMGTSPEPCLYPVTHTVLVNHVSRLRRMYVISSDSSDSSGDHYVPPSEAFANDPVIENIVRRERERRRQREARRAARSKDKGGPSRQKKRSPSPTDDNVEATLRRAYLWSEAKKSSEQPSNNPGPSNIPEPPTLTEEELYTPVDIIEPREADLPRYVNPSHIQGDRSPRMSSDIDAPEKGGERSKKRDCPFWDPPHNFKRIYNMPEDMEVISGSSTYDRLVFQGPGMHYFPHMAVYEGGLRFPLHPFLRRVLCILGITTAQFTVNAYRITMAFARLREQHPQLDLGFPEFFGVYYAARLKGTQRVYLACRTRYRDLLIDGLPAKDEFPEDFFIAKGNYMYGPGEPEDPNTYVPHHPGILCKRSQSLRSFFFLLNCFPNSELYLISPFFSVTENVEAYKSCADPEKIERAFAIPRDDRKAPKLLGYTPSYQNCLQRKERAVADPEGTRPKVTKQKKTAKRRTRPLVVEHEFRPYIPDSRPSSPPGSHQSSEQHSPPRKEGRIRRERDRLTPSPSDPNSPSSSDTESQHSSDEMVAELRQPKNLSRRGKGKETVVPEPSPPVPNRPPPNPRTTGIAFREKRGREEETVRPEPAKKSAKDKGVVTDEANPRIEVPPKEKSNAKPVSLAPTYTREDGSGVREILQDDSGLLDGCVAAGLLKAVFLERDTLGVPDDFLDAMLLQCQSALAVSLFT